MNYQVQEENVRTLQEHENELSALETEREELISSFKEKEKNLLEEVENVRESSFLEIENNVSEMSALREKLENLSEEYHQVDLAFPIVQYFAISSALLLETPSI